MTFNPDVLTNFLCPTCQQLLQSLRLPTFLFLVPPLLCSLDFPLSPSQILCFGLKHQWDGKDWGKRIALRKKLSQGESQRIQGPHPSLWDVRY